MAHFRPTAQRSACALQVVNATYGDEFSLRTYGGATEAGTVTCVTPPRHNARTTELELALNAQQVRTEIRDRSKQMTMLLSPTRRATHACAAPDHSSSLSRRTQYTKDKLPFVFYTEVVLHSLWPLGGPQHGGTQMFINASHLHNGSDFRCRFFYGADRRSNLARRFC